MHIDAIHGLHSRVSCSVTRRLGARIMCRSHGVIIELLAATYFGANTQPRTIALPLGGKQDEVVVLASRKK